mgnify:CR=1 FL=1
MKAYSLDLRERVAAASQQPGCTIGAVAAQFSVSVSFVEKLLQRQRTRPGDALDSANDIGDRLAAMQRLLEWRFGSISNDSNRAWMSPARRGHLLTFEIAGRTAASDW